jgi:hypothetical protein
MMDHNDRRKKKQSTNVFVMLIKKKRMIRDSKNKRRFHKHKQAFGYSKKICAPDCLFYLKVQNIERAATPERCALSQAMFSFFFTA